MTDYYVGLMSGTSMDGIDAVLVSFSEATLQFHASHNQSYPPDLKNDLLAAVREPLDVELDKNGELDRRVGECFRDAALAVIEQGGVDNHDIKAIGSHGQTLRHQPDARRPYSLQIGLAKIIVAGTGLTTVTNFRQADINAGGQGAPLTPPFHEWLFASDDHDRVVVNMGGIANITVLPQAGAPVIGFDTGPGNGLMDAWIRQHRNEPFDRDGSWAASGQVNEGLLAQMLRDPYFSLPPPKSTGFEYFNLEWLHQHDIERAAPADVQATLCELSAATIADAIGMHAADAEVVLCGGGVYNFELRRRLHRNLARSTLADTSIAGLSPDWVEAVAFAWLAMRTLAGQTGNLPSVTGARHKVVLGDIHFP